MLSVIVEVTNSVGVKQAEPHRHTDVRLRF